MIKCLTHLLFSPNHCGVKKKRRKKRKSLYVAQNKCIICAFEISGRWSRESIYTILLPGHSCGPGAPTSWETHRLEPYSGAFYEIKIPMGSSAYSPLVRENHCWGRRIFLVVLVEIDQKQMLGEF